MAPLANLKSVAVASDPEYMEGFAYLSAYLKPEKLKRLLELEKLDHNTTGAMVKALAKHIKADSLNTKHIDAGVALAERIYNHHRSKPVTLKNYFNTATEHGLDPTLQAMSLRNVGEEAVTPVAELMSKYKARSERENLREAMRTKGVKKHNSLALALLIKKHNPTRVRRHILNTKHAQENTLEGLAYSALKDWDTTQDLMKHPKITNENRKAVFDAVGDPSTRLTPKSALKLLNNSRTTPKNTDFLFHLAGKDGHTLRVSNLLKKATKSDIRLLRSIERKQGIDKAMMRWKKLRKNRLEKRGTNPKTHKRTSKARPKKRN